MVIDPPSRPQGWTIAEGLVDEKWTELIRVQQAEATLHVELCKSAPPAGC